MMQQDWYSHGIPAVLDTVSMPTMYSDGRAMLSRRLWMAVASAMLAPISPFRALTWPTSVRCRTRWLARPSKAVSTKFLRTADEDQNIQNTDKFGRDQQAPGRGVGGFNEAIKRPSLEHGPVHISGSIQNWNRFDRRTCPLYLGSEPERNTILLPLLLYYSSLSIEFVLLNTLYWSSIFGIPGLTVSVDLECFSYLVHTYCVSKEERMYFGNARIS